MADPLSIAASIAGLLSLVGTVVPQGYALCKKLKGRSENVRLLMNETTSFSGLLYSVRAHILSEANSWPNFLPDDSGASLEEAVKDCENLLLDIKLFLAKIGDRSTVRLLVSIEFLTDGVNQLVARMERYKALFILTFELNSK